MQFESTRVPARLRLLSLSEDVLIEVGPRGDHLVALTQWGDIRIDDTSPVVHESLQRMSLGPVSLENLPLLRNGEQAAPWDRLERVLEPLGNSVVQSLGLDDEAGPLLSVAPVSRRAKFVPPPQVDVRRPVRLSRFVTVRVRDRELVLESPLTQHRVLLHRPIAAWVAASLGKPTSTTRLASLLRIAEPVVADIVAYLVASGVVLTGEQGTPERFDEDDDPALTSWSAHDLLFHSRSRMGRHNGHPDVALPRVDRLLAAPVTKPVPPGRRFPLYRPVLADVAAKDPVLTDVIESRQSHRELAERPPHADQLAELLFRVARIRKTASASTGSPPVSYTISDRPYPSTARLYELELYVSIDRCVGLPRGSYHYDPAEHALTLVNDSERELGELLDNAKIAAGSRRRPPVLITVTTRIARLSWLFSGIAYATSLKHVGELQQTLYLVATAMELAPCALAIGDSGATEEALRLDWPAEVSVGEFVIGGRP